MLYDNILAKHQFRWMGKPLVFLCSVWDWIEVIILINVNWWGIISSYYLILTPLDTIFAIRRFCKIVQITPSSIFYTIDGYDIITLNAISNFQLELFTWFNSMTCCTWGSTHLVCLVWWKQQRNCEIYTFNKLSPKLTEKWWWWWWWWWFFTWNSTRSHGLIITQWITSTDAKKIYV